MYISSSNSVPCVGSVLVLAAPALVPSKNIAATEHVASGVRGGHGVWATCESPEDTTETVSSLFDRGVSVVVVSVSLFGACASAGLPLDRVCVRVDSLGDIPSQPRAQVALLDLDQATTAFGPLPNKVKLVVRFRQAVNVNVATVAALDLQNIDVVVPGDFDRAACLAAMLNTDRPDGFFATAVADPCGVALGFAFSSKASLEHVMTTAQGAYQSRSRKGLWIKGLTSGAVQRVYRIDRDCDGDCLRFTVEQADPGFCHNNTRTCFGPDSGLTALEATLRSRKAKAPAGSYTARLFNDTTLLHAKIREEAGELCDASTKDEIASEAADLFYFAMVKAVAAGVTLADIEEHLDRRAKKVTRRAGDAKPGAIEREVALAAEKAKASPSTTTPATPAPTPAKVAIKMKVHNHTTLSTPQKTALLQRPIYDLAEITSRVKPIIESVQQSGDKAIIDLTAKFDRVELSSTVLNAPFPQSLIDQVDPKVKSAIDTAFENIRKFHAAQLNTSTLTVETMPGVVCTRFSRPIERVGLYVPGGTAILPSTTMMLGVPAMVAGCSEIVVASPPRKDGTPVPEVVYVANKIGAKAIVLAGGAQAVAAMAYGTASVPKVDKIVGPGNQYVTAAKMLLQNDTKAMISIDMPAGPSELLVICDNNANPAYIVSDLLSQAEHGTDSQVILVAIDPTPDFLARLQQELHTQGEALPRSDIVRVSIGHSYILTVPDRKTALEFSNQYAPEHLILHISEPASVLPDIINAGSVFVGPWSPESLGDYASGTNHTLPTYGYARMYSGVNTDTFVKYLTSQEVTKFGLDLLGDAVVTLAEVEGLEAHRNAVAIRLKDIRAGRV
ncbi:hypothetical protein BCR33DRAFT_847601 [Rhizoclosmatium globosum]|uniref:Histidine biosynthesis trifunctional protein n=1 Tax=Rhizoclosmatium globosum TaxID=329046 RepID=A0A1Y2CPX9_9FUNG|nr:hypothetical protein BCR33DRAFT_847601 [Rhizoclosmatium globosum]|eukprot:ORY48894.1 hypothetical protein BCR33DRAFT_847601 [Rhizoclosmatium globosum]